MVLSIDDKAVEKALRFEDIDARVIEMVIK